MIGLVGFLPQKEVLIFWKYGIILNKLVINLPFSSYAIQWNTVLR